MDAKMKIVGSSNHTKEEREHNDYYATDPQAFIDFLWAFQDRDGEELSRKIWEPACGEGNLAKVLMKRNHLVLGTDKIDRGFGNVYDFLGNKERMKWEGDIITNPPYKGSMDIDFVKRSLDIVSKNRWVIMLFKVQFLASKKRYFLFQELNPRYIYVHSSRIKIWKNNEDDGGSNALDYAWFVWQKGYQGETITRWIPSKDYRGEE